MTTPVEGLWQTLGASGSVPVHTRVAADHPLDLFAQIDAQHRVGLLAISADKPGTVPKYAAVDLAVGQRADGQWATSLSLAQQGLLPMFALMCEQIIDQGRRVSPGTCAGDFVLSQVARWHRLLALGSDGRLSAEEQQGLFGELEILRLAIDRFGSEAAAMGWKGPDDAPQDFDLPSGLVEVKTVQAGVPSFNISSLEQLDVDGGRLCIAVVDIVRCAVGTGGASLHAAVEALRDMLTCNPIALRHFEEQLQKAGYVDRDEYRAVEYRMTRVRWFVVRDDFPRLARSRLPASIAGGRYQLLIAALASFETNTFADDGRT